MATISVLGLNKYLAPYNKSVFDELVLPEGIDKETLTDNILLKSAEFECIYADPDFLTGAIGLWGKKYYRTIEKWIAALNTEYNPLENYDRIEEWTDKTKGKNEASSTDNTHTGGNTENRVSAFDAGDYQPKDRQSSSADTSSDNTAVGSNEVDFNHTGRLHGNIGVTTSQQMLEAELNIALWSLYDRVTDVFLAEFCIPVY